ncbi:MAG: ubiquinol oxidase subunit II [Pseudomonadota bacterium]
MRGARILILSILAGLVSGCELIVLRPAGDVAVQQGQLIVYATVLMLIVILPVMALTVFFAVRYRASNKRARYEPDWDHSISLEIVVWSVPLAIIICLAGLTWVATHRLNPYDPLRRISAETPVDPAVEPMVVRVVSLDWKWLFIYPEHGIATVNEAAAIVDRPIEFQLTSATVMNSFYVPALAGQIYAMAGMQTELNAVMNVPGVYDGFSANYSGAGFSQMRFKFHAFDEAGFDGWVERVRGDAPIMDRAAYVALEEASIDHPVTYYDGIEDGLWDRILNLCVGEDDLCLNDMMMVDALGGGGIAGLYNRELYRGLCTADDPRALFAVLRPSLQGRSDDILAAISLLPDAPTGSQDPPSPQAN